MVGLLFFFFNDTATTEIYTLSLHDALPISGAGAGGRARDRRDRGDERAPRRADPRGVLDLRDGADAVPGASPAAQRAAGPDRKSTRLNSSHANISYAVFCLKKKARMARPRQ